MSPGEVRGPKENRDAPYLSRLGPMPSGLVFIMGCHRSGTSLIYHLLAQSGCCEFISVYDVVQYRSLLANRLEGGEAEARSRLTRYLAGEKDRGLDRLPVGPDAPEEYRFILAKPPPPFLLSPKRRVTLLSFAPHLTPASRDRFVEICRKKQFLAGGVKPLVLKNPNDYYTNFMAVHEMFPEAKFIFIHRHPLEILNSFMRGFSSIFKTKSNYAALIDPAYEELYGLLPFKRLFFQLYFRGRSIIRVLLSNLIESQVYFLRNFAKLPPGLCRSMTYPDLCRDTNRFVAETGRWLGLSIDPPGAPEGFVAPRNLSILEPIHRLYRERLEEFRPYLKYCGFPDVPENLQITPAK